MHRWYCPDCGRLLKRPPYRLDDDRYHSGHCRTPMLHATVVVHTAPDVRDQSSTESKES